MCGGHKGGAWAWDERIGKGINQNLLQRGVTAFNGQKQNDYWDEDKILCWPVVGVSIPWGGDTFTAYDTCLEALLLLIPIFL